MIVTCWMKNSYMKTNASKRHLIVSGKYKDLICKSNDDKLFGITIDKEPKI